MCVVVDYGCVVCLARLHSGCRFVCLRAASLACCSTSERRGLHGIDLDAADGPRRECRERRRVPRQRIIHGRRDLGYDLPAY